MFFYLRLVNKYIFETGEINLYCKSLEECYKALALASVRYHDFEYSVYRDADVNSNGFLIAKGWYCT